MRLYQHIERFKAPVPDEPVIDLRARDAEPLDASPYGYDAVLPASWRLPETSADRRPKERPTGVTAGPLPRHFWLEQRFPPLQRVVYKGPVTGSQVEVKLTMLGSIRLHSTGIERPFRDLDGRLTDRDHLRLLQDAFGRDRELPGCFPSNTPQTLLGAKREWYQQLSSPGRYGFAIARRHLVLLEYEPPERDPRRRNFGIAYKRIVMAYRIGVR